jgi:hypothetical protein
MNTPTQGTYVGTAYISNVPYEIEYIPTPTGTGHSYRVYRGSSQIGHDVPGTSRVSELSPSGAEWIADQALAHR